LIATWQGIFKLARKQISNLSRVLWPIYEAAPLIEQVTTTDEILDLTTRVLSPLGFGPMTVWRRPDAGEDMRNAMMLSTFPSEWMREYFSKDDWRVDPVVVDMLRFGTAQRWQDCRSNRTVELDGAALDVLDRAARYGLADGYLVPIFGLGGYVGSVSYASAIELPKDPQIGYAVQILAFPIFRRTAALTQISIAGPPPAQALTPRERECLEWAGQGKTDREIAAVLGIGENTVRSYLENAKQKFGTQSRTRAVVRALQLGIIRT
jgi:DNA-binding CsgD family transcriptional regulator